MSKIHDKQNRDKQGQPVIPATPFSALFKIALKLDKSLEFWKKLSLSMACLDNDLNILVH